MLSSSLCLGVRQLTVPFYKGLQVIKLHPTRETGALKIGSRKVVQQYLRPSSQQYLVFREESPINYIHPHPRLFRSEIYKWFPCCPLREVSSYLFTEGKKKIQWRKVVRHPVCEYFATYFVSIQLSLLSSFPSLLNTTMRVLLSQTLRISRSIGLPSVMRGTAVRQLHSSMRLCEEDKPQSNAHEIVRVS